MITKKYIQEAWDDYRPGFGESFNPEDLATVREIFFVACIIGVMAAARAIRSEDMGCGFFASVTAEAKEFGERMAAELGKLGGGGGRPC